MTDHIVAFDSELPITVKEGDLRRWTWAFASLVAPLPASEVRDGFEAFLVQMERHIPEKLPDEPDAPYVVVTDSDGSYVWNRESDDHWRQKDGPSYSWVVLAQTARERKWTITLPGETL